MIRPLHLTLAVCAMAGFASGVAAQDSDLDPAVAARHAHMDLYAFNLSVLGAMAQGNMDYDAEMASAAADNIAALAAMDQTRYWREGTDSDSMFGSRALPAIWENLPDVMAKSDDLVTQANAMAAVAGDGLEAVQGQIRALGGACGACHEDYRMRDD